jgi:phage-related protein
VKGVVWLGDTLAIVRAFPKDVQHDIGYALYVAQIGDKHPDAKPLRGFGGAAVLEIVERFDGDTYRAIYTVRFKSAVYVLHAFQKKSKRAISTPKQDIDLVRARLNRAEDVEAGLR